MAALGIAPKTVAALRVPVRPDERGDPVEATLVSALPPKADIERHDRHVRFVPKADICSAANCTLFDHLVGAAPLMTVA
jgi:hypothetical protein